MSFVTAATPAATTASTPPAVSVASSSPSAASSQDAALAAALSADAASIFTSVSSTSSYTTKPRQMFPGFDSFHRMVCMLLSEKAGPDARVLVLGAGGGLELRSFAERRPHWTFVGVDPSGEMLEEAQKTLGPDLMKRVTLHKSFIPDAPVGPFDAATCLLTLHFVPLAEKLSTLQSIRSRLKPGAPFVVAHFCLDRQDPRAPVHIDRYCQFALEGGMSPEDVAVRRMRLEHSLHCIAPEQDEALLAEAGFTGTELIYAGLNWRGWICYA